MRVCCPACGESYPVEAGMADADGKRLAALLAEMEPVLGRAVLGYLRLFKPQRSALRTTRAIRIVEDLLALVRTGSVCRDERGGLRRQASPALWAAGIEQMLALPGKLTLPLANHHYLRAIVYGLADAAGAAGERAKEADLRAGKRRAGPSDNVMAETPLQSELAYLLQRLRLGLVTREQYEVDVAAAKDRFGGEA